MNDAVNALLHLGKGGALAAVEDCLARCAGGSVDGLFLVLRVLFDVPADPGWQPPLRLGASTPPPPANPRLLPLFPLLLVDDRPLLLVAGYVLGGLAEPVRAHLEHFRAHGTLRATPLAPSAPPEQALEGFRAQYTEAYGAAPASSLLRFIARQLALPEAAY